MYPYTIYIYCIYTIYIYIVVEATRCLGWSIGTRKDSIILGLTYFDTYPCLLDLRPSLPSNSEKESRARPAHACFAFFQRGPLDGKC